MGAKVRKKLESSGGTGRFCKEVHQNIHVPGAEIPQAVHDKDSRSQSRKKQSGIKPAITLTIVLKGRKKCKKQAKDLVNTERVYNFTLIKST